MRLSAILILVFAAGGFAADPQALADRIDHHLAAPWKAASIEPAPQADDAEFLRRAYLDLTGRIPRPRDVHDFLADANPAKRAKLIDDLLDTPRSASHFAAVWRAILLPEATAMAEARLFQPGFELWLRDRFRANTPYDKLVRELLTTPIAGSPTPVMRDPKAANPLAFFAAKEAKPENLAAATTRAFLGVQLECAQCHDHPFARWTRDQFWQTAAFFAGLERHGDNLFAEVSDDPKRRDLKLPTGNKTVTAAFLDDAVPDWNKGQPREVLAAWITTRDNPFFAKTAANRVWSQMFGIGLVDPPDDFHDGNAASHPELLDDLATAFADSGFDLRFLFRAIARTKAYGRTSRQTHASQADPRKFARMPVKGLTGEQFFDSLAQATGYREPAGERSAMRERFLTRFAAQGRAPATSVPQALMLLNGSFLHDLTTRGNSPSLIAVIETPGLSTAERVEALYLLTLSRKPTDRERERVIPFVLESGTGRVEERLSDLFWVLLNTAEFRLNH